jgi:hypothetical protein
VAGRSSDQMKYTSESIDRSQQSPSLFLFFRHTFFRCDPAVSFLFSDVTFQNTSTRALRPAHLSRLRFPNLGFVCSLHPRVS